MYVAIGFTKKTHGLKGELKVSIKEQYFEDFLKTETVFLELKGKKVPYFVESIRSAAEPIVKFEDIDKIDEAQLISSKEIYLRQSDILEEDEREIIVENLGYGYCEGFKMIDQAAVEIGLIERIVPMPQSEMALLMYNNREVYIPMIPQFIKTIDKKTRTVYVGLPDGLLEM